MTQHFEYMIAGAGLAGLSTALRLTERNKSVCVIDSKGIAGGASGVPLGLANYATGRFATLTWEASNCMNFLKSDLDLIQHQSPIQFYAQNGVLRPAVDNKIEARMYENYQNTDWPEHAAAQWINKDDLKSFNTTLNTEYGGLWLEHGMTVNIPVYLNELMGFLEKKGVIFIQADVKNINKNESEWIIDSKDLNTVAATHLIQCIGADVVGNSNEFKAPIHPVKGQLLVLKRKEPILFNHSVSALGYFAVLDKYHFAVGSTYEHSFNDLSTTESAKEELLSKVDRILPELLNGAEIINHWSGVRASTPNRMPILGSHSELTNLHYYVGLGSKGLVYSSYASRLLIDNLIDSIPLPSNIDIARFSDR